LVVCDNDDDKMKLIINLLTQLELQVKDKNYDYKLKLEGEKKYSHFLRIFKMNTRSDKIAMYCDLDIPSEINQII
jgi:hypothetical protein